MGGIIGLNWMANVRTNFMALPKSVNVFTKTETMAWNGKLAELPGVKQGNIMGA
jgi:hypothetical protein